MVITIANTALNNFQWKEASLISYKLIWMDSPLLHDSVSGQDVYAAFNPHDYFVTVEKTMADTNLESPDDFVKECVTQTYNVAPFSSIPLKSM
ncbi:unnamed protein product [Brassica napus]|uniref:(rape) hypothetical protein n=1 Tax=Brassica napus TaxID=3708 RepID=A0A816TWB4_BRANA|nr:unnamed protein product [Brassica napus]